MCGVVSCFVRTIVAKRSSKQFTHKVFITADPAVRAARRARQDVELGKDGVDVERTESALRERDAKDSSRQASPLAQADDAVVLDTTDLTLEQVIERMAAMIADLDSP